jgi:uncharacterized protein
MQFSEEAYDFPCPIHSYKDGKVKINDEWHNSPLIISPNQVYTWQTANNNLEKKLNKYEISQILEHKAKIVILGLGDKFDYPNPACLSPLHEANVGIEIMSSDAACRTYNILASEKRDVLLALWQ